jgi:DNA-binding Lrp family transcriptional regulator
VSAEPAVSHNYAREHAWNLWFVVAGIDHGPVQATVDRIEQATGLQALRLPMRRAYRVSLAFDLFGDTVGDVAARAAEPVGPGLRPLAARLEGGLPLVEQPFRALGETIDMDEGAVLRALGRWCEHGTVRRLGVVLRHHEFGIAANAMAVYAPPAAQVDAAGRRLAAQPGVTLCYRRERVPGWPYTLYAMVHGREREAVLQTLAQATAAAGLGHVRREVLFSTQRFKQTGSRYFSGEAS